MVALVDATDVAAGSASLERLEDLTDLTIRFPRKINIIIDGLFSAVDFIVALWFYMTDRAVA